MKSTVKLSPHQRFAAGFVLFLSLLLLQACDQAQINGLIPGESSEAQVVERFGAPENIWDDEEGNKVFEYNRQPAGQINYMISISPEGKLVQIRQVLSPSNFDKITVGMPMEEVRKRLGNPAKKVTYALSKESVYTWRYLDGAQGMLFTVDFDADLKVKSKGQTVEETGGGN